MADTISVVFWKLDHPCPLLGGASVAREESPLLRLHPVNTYRRAVAEGRLFEGIVLSDMKRVRGIRVPQRGIPAEELLRAMGGVQHVEAYCAACPANARRRYDAHALAGCHGYFLGIDDEFLEWSIREGVLTGRMNQDFPHTTPRWFGLWIDVPLKRNQCEDLLCLTKVWLDAMTSETSQEDQDSIRSFRAALEVSLERRIPLHASYAPPGHADFGHFTTFPHCPRCHAGTSHSPWRPDEWPREPIECTVCGHPFVMAETASGSFSDDEEVSNIDRSETLTELLGSEGENAFVTRYLRAQGVSERDIRLVIDAIDPWRSINPGSDPIRSDSSPDSLLLKPAAEEHTVPFFLQIC